jgi:very-short-patch-repair endonuclease
MSVLGHNPGDAFWSEWKREVLKKLHQFSPQGLSNSVYAMSVLGHNPGDAFWTVWKRVASNKLPEFKPQELSNSVYATLLLESPKDLIDLQEKMISKFFELYLRDKSSISVEDRHQIYLAIQYLNKQYPTIFSDNQKALQSFQREVLQYLKEHSKNQQSRSEKILGTYLKSQFPEIKEELEEGYWHDTLVSHLDFALPNRKIAIQFDGPTHFIRDVNGREIQRPQDLFQNKLLASAGWKVIRIPYHYFMTKEGKITNTTAIDKLLQDFLCTSPDTKDEVKVGSPKEGQSSSSNVTCSPSSRQVGADLKSEMKSITPILQKSSKDEVLPVEGLKPTVTQPLKPKFTLNPNAKSFVPSWQR